MLVFNDYTVMKSGVLCSAAIVDHTCFEDRLWGLSA